MSVGRELEDLRKRLDWMETQVAKLPSRLSQNVGGGGGGGGGDFHYTAVTKAGLPDASSVNVASIGRVDGEDSDNGMVCVPNPAKDAWHSLNFWE